MCFLIIIFVTLFLSPSPGDARVAFHSDTVTLQNKTCCMYCTLLLLNWESRGSCCCCCVGFTGKGQQTGVRDRDQVQQLQRHSGLYLMSINGQRVDVLMSAVGSGPCPVSAARSDIGITWFSSGCSLFWASDETTSDGSNVCILTQRMDVMLESAVCTSQT